MAGRDDFTLLIRVTEEDIGTGLTGNPWHCPIAKAVDRLTTLMPEVNYGSVCLYRNYEIVYCADLPVEARLFIGNFDAGNPVAPFTFELTFLVRKKKSDGDQAG